MCANLRFMYWSYLLTGATLSVGRAALRAYPPQTAALSYTTYSEVPTAPWCGLDDVQTVDVTDYFGDNLSGLYFESSPQGADPILWAVENFPSTLYRLVWNGTFWLPENVHNWDDGKRLHYTDGTGDPDAEDITKGGVYSNKIYVCTERDGHEGESRNIVILYELDLEDDNVFMNGTAQWDLTADLPAVSESNKGLEALTWVSDEYLVSNGFYDESKGQLYDPADYPDHADGLILVGLEDNGYIYAYALNHKTESYSRIATFSSGFAAVMALSFDEDNGYLWSVCDDNCDGVHHVFSVNENGQFAQISAFARPTTMGGNYNSEGFTVSQDTVCFDGYKPVLWSDDTQDVGHAIRQDKIPCGSFIAPYEADDDDGDDWTAKHAAAIVFAIIGGLIVIVGLCVIISSYFRNRREVEDKFGAADDPNGGIDMRSTTTTNPIGVVVA